MRKTARGKVKRKNRKGLNRCFLFDFIFFSNSSPLWFAPSFLPSLFPQLYKCLRSNFSNSHRNVDSRKFSIFNQTCSVIEFYHNLRIARWEFFTFWKLTNDRNYLNLNHWLKWIEHCLSLSILIKDVLHKCVQLWDVKVQLSNLNSNPWPLSKLEKAYCFLSKNFIIPTPLEKSWSKSLTKTTTMIS